MIYALIFILNFYVPTTQAKATSSQNNLLVHSTTAKLTKETDISGFWEGTISRDEGYGKRVMFEIEVIFTQKGKDITGISIVRATDNSKTYNAKMELVGKFKSSYLKYVETKIVSSDPIPDADWCIKKVELIYKNINNQPTLEGIWEGVTGSNRNCIPGRVSLKRKPPRV
jgi:hypothetical protein